MNTERPDNDDAARQPEETGSAEQTEKVAQRDGAEETPEAPEAPETSAAEADGESSGAEESAAAEVAETVADAPEVQKATAAQEAPEAPEGPEGPAVDLGDLGEPPSAPRRRSPLLVASVAAAVLLVGGGGAYLSAQAGGGGGTGSGAPSGGGTPGPLVLDDYAGTGSGGASNGIAPGEPNPYGVVTYKADGTLPDGPGSAPVYWAKGAVGKDEVARLAKALGVDGTPVVDGEAWKVGAGNDGSGPVLRVNRQAPGMWTFSRYAPGTDVCKGGVAKCTQDPAAPAADPVSEAAAKKAAAPILKAVGQDDAKVDASQVMGAQRVVNADPEVGGLPTYGWTTGISVGADGVVIGGNGQLKAPAKGDTYPLLTAEEALKALNAAPGGDQRMGIGGCASPVPLKDRLESPCGSSTTGSSTGSPQGETVTVDDAVLGLAPHTSGGRQVLVPSWLFEVKGTGAADEYRVTQPAVDPAYLKAATTPTPAPSATSGTRNVQVDGYTAEGEELVVSFTGGVCADYEATAKESGDQVTVTVTETPWPDKVCILIAKQYHRTVQLDEPLGSRKVVGSDGKAVPLEKAGARLPDVQ
ncbi:hypothetical protein [Streptomyces sp. T028]|uniref:hypothetical protein n=1 Tax=Streptomyces sp. T028 TaxID=3394379 RepID=UPI003A883C7B